MIRQLLKLAAESKAQHLALDTTDSTLVELDGVKETHISPYTDCAREDWNGP